MVGVCIFCVLKSHPKSTVRQMRKTEKREPTVMASQEVWEAALVACILQISLSCFSCGLLKNSFEGWCFGGQKPKTTQR